MMYRIGLGLLLTLGALLLLLPNLRADAQATYDAGVRAHSRGDVVEALGLLQQAADEGHVPAMVRLAYILDKSEQNEAAFALYQRAADAGDSEATLAVGVMYANGEGVAADPVQALAHIQRAAEARHGPAMVVLAEAHLRGDLGLKPDVSAALRWLTAAVEAGYAPAATELARLKARTTPPTTPAPAEKR